ncbi:MAG TPA: 3'-5' exonuclease [Dysgonamonadaceae bacterium]|nr:3'-5' exonuclease domain-containing protein 2 [Bacteroidales bacterium]HKM44944.1 3'-5' exonuclease [Dysgonamonadaceae bacterium]
MGLVISKEKIRDLSIETFNGEIIVIDKVEDVADAVRYLKQFKVIGFDTETKPVFRKNASNKVALMQLSTLDKCFLFRLNLIQYPDELDDLICSKDVMKVGLSLRDDFAALRQRSDCAPLNFVDLQTFVKDYGIKDMSLQKIYAILFNKKIAKNQRLSNWEAKTLKESQKMYASIDAWACLKIYNYLIKNGAPEKAE